MSKVWIGTAGIGVGAKDRSTIGGIKYASELKLNALEIEFVRKVYLNKKAAEEAGKVAKELGVKLSVHAPYFLNLCSEKKQTVEASKKFILDSLDRAEAMGAEVVVAHVAYYSGLNEKEAFEKVKREIEDIFDRAKAQGIKKAMLGLETTGKKSQFGTLDECIGIVKEIKNCCVVIDWAHIFARQGGKIDFKEIFDKVLELKPKHLHTHFSGIEFGNKGEKKHLNLTEGAKPNYEPLVKEILKRKVDITLISESPNLENDALLLKKLFEKNGYKFT
jgi:deoxyribonuclease-4